MLRGGVSTLEDLYWFSNCCLHWDTSVVYTETPLLFTLRYLCCLHSDTYCCLHWDTFVVYTQIPLLFTLRYLCCLHPNTCCLHSDTFVVYTQTLLLFTPKHFLVYTQTPLLRTSSWLIPPSWPWATSARGCWKDTRVESLRRRGPTSPMRWEGREKEGEGQTQLLKDWENKRELFVIACKQQ